ncbi:hypothetical protein ACH34E_05285 [Elizabethkingia anophelis]
MKKFISYLLIFLSIFSFAQKPDNALQGYYGIKGNGGYMGVSTLMVTEKF